MYRDHQYINTVKHKLTSTMIQTIRTNLPGGKVVYTRLGITSQTQTCFLLGVGNGKTSRLLLFQTHQLFFDFPHNFQLFLSDSMSPRRENWEFMLAEGCLNRSITFEEKTSEKNFIVNTKLGEYYEGCF